MICATAADLVEVFGAGILRLGLALRDERDEMVRAHRFLERDDGSLAAHEERDHEVREERQVPQRDEREHVRYGDGILVRHVSGASFHMGVC